MKRRERGVGKGEGDKRKEIKERREEERGGRAKGKEGGKRGNKEEEIENGRGPSKGEGNCQRMHAKEVFKIGQCGGR